MTLLRPKGHLSPTALWVLGTLAFLPLLSVLVRSLAVPFVVGPGFDAIRGFGNTLNQIFSLIDVPPDQRDHVLYLLLLPTCALMVAVARLTFGLRVLGFRSILISVGFHQSGIIPSLLLIGVAVATIVLVRPWLRRIRLPYYGRVSVILCVVATTMVGALLAGPWMRSDMVWGVAYFPVIVLGMLAEGIAHTLDRDNAVTAWWRAISTILLAFVIALVCWAPALRSLLLEFPELVLTQIVAIVLVSEFLGLGLLQGWDRKVARMVLERAVVNPGAAAGPGAVRVAVVRSRLDADAAGRAGRHTGRRRALRSVRTIVHALREGGYDVQVMEGDASLLAALNQYLPPTLPGCKPRGIVLNLAPGVRGDAPATQVPAMLEMAGIAYVGPTPHGHALATDRFVARTVMEGAGVPIPTFRLMVDPGTLARGLRYPAIVRPRLEPGLGPRIVRDDRQLRAAVRRMIGRGRQGAFVEEMGAGRRIRVALLGNARVECLPLVELHPHGREKICPALLDGIVAERIREYARAAYRACACRDYARVDVRVGESGQVQVLEVNSLGILAGRGAFAIAAAAAGYTFPQLVCRIIEVARSRHASGETPHPDGVRSRGAAKPVPLRQASRMV